MQTLISIIVPVYNAEKTLTRCIESIINQSYACWELFLINDGSTDSSPRICEEFAERDNRIKVISKVNGGVSSARNAALSLVTGEWLTFVDSDDWVEESYLENLLKYVSDTVDLVISYATICDGRSSFREKYSSRMITRDSFEEMFMYNDMNWHTSPWGKLYRMTIIRQEKLNFCEGMHIGEDALFLYSFMLVSRNIFITEHTDYHYYAFMNGSLTKRINTLHSELLSFQNIRYIVNRLFQERHIQDIKAVADLNWLVASYIQRVLNALYYNKVDFRDRMHTLCGLDLSFYITYIKPDTWYQSVLHYLLKVRFFLLYDIIRWLVVAIKKRIRKRK